MLLPHNVPCNATKAPRPWMLLLEGPHGGQKEVAESLAGLVRCPRDPHPSCLLRGAGPSGRAQLPVGGARGPPHIPWLPTALLSPAPLQGKNLHVLHVLPWFWGAHTDLGEAPEVSTWIWGALLDLGCLPGFGVLPWLWRCPGVPTWVWGAPPNLGYSPGFGVLPWTWGAPHPSQPSLSAPSPAPLPDHSRGAHATPLALGRGSGVPSPLGWGSGVPSPLGGVSSCRSHLFQAWTALWFPTWWGHRAGSSWGGFSTGHP